MGYGCMVYLDCKESVLLQKYIGPAKWYTSWSHKFTTRLSGVEWVDGPTLRAPEQWRMISRTKKGLGPPKIFEKN